MWRKRISIRVYGSIEPLTSHRTTMRRGRTPGCFHARRTGSPPARKERRTVRGRSGWRLRRATGLYRRERRSGPRMRAIAMSRSSSASSSGLQVAKSFFEDLDVAVAPPGLPVDLFGLYVVLVRTVQASGGRAYQRQRLARMLVHLTFFFAAEKEG